MIFYGTSLKRLAIGAAVVAVVAGLVGCNDSKEPAAQDKPSARETGLDPATGRRYPSYSLIGPYMEPTISHRQRVRAIRPSDPAEDLRRFDIVRATWWFDEHRARALGCSGAFRIIALPDEVWSQRRGVIHINGDPLFEPYSRRRGWRTLTMRDIPPKGTLTRVPKRTYLLMGDNRPAGGDSRSCGVAPASAILRVVEIDDHSGDPLGQVIPFGVRPPP